MTTPVGIETEKRLRAAMNRLVAGTPRASDGRLTISNLAIEAGMSRATANRAIVLLDEFRCAIAAAKMDRPSSRSSMRTDDRQKKNEADKRAQHTQVKALLSQQQAQRARRAAPEKIVVFGRKEK